MSGAVTRGLAWLRVVWRATHGFRRSLAWLRKQVTPTIHSVVVTSLSRRKFRQPGARLSGFCFTLLLSN